MFSFPTIDPPAVEDSLDDDRVRDRRVRRGRGRVRRRHAGDVDVVLDSDRPAREWAVGGTLDLAERDEDVEWILARSGSSDNRPGAETRCRRRQPRECEELVDCLQQARNRRLELLRLGEGYVERVPGSEVDDLRRKRWTDSGSAVSRGHQRRLRVAATRFGEDGRRGRRVLATSVITRNPASVVLPW